MISRIKSLKSGALNENDRLEIARLLLKAGYTVRIGKEKQNSKPNSQNIYFVEYWEDGKTLTQARKGTENEN